MKVPVQYIHEYRNCFNNSGQWHWTIIVFNFGITWQNYSCGNEKYIISSSYIIYINKEM